MDKVARLTADQQRKALRFLEDLEGSNAPGSNITDEAKAVWQMVDEVTGQIPREKWSELPSEGSINVGSYLYGAPKE